MLLGFHSNICCRGLASAVALLLLAVPSYGQDAEPAIPFEYFGEWHVDVEFEGQAHEGTITFSFQEGQLGARLESLSLGENGQNVVYDGEKISWTFPVSQLGNTDFKAEARVSDGKLTGTLVSPFGEFALNGVRKGAAAAETGPELGKAEEVAGLWTLGLDFGGQAMSLSADFKETSEGLGLTITSDQGTIEAEDVRYLADGSVSWTLRVPQMGEDPLTATGTVSGDSMRGTIVSPFGELPFEGTRGAPVELGDPENVIGVWTLSADFAGQAMSLKADFLESGDGLGLTITSDQGTLEADEVQYLADGSVSWSLNVPQLGQDPLIVTGQVDGESISGQIAAPFGEIPFTGVKGVPVEPGNPEDIVGVWALTADFGGQSLELEADFQSSGDELGLTISSPQGTIQANEVEYLADGSVTWSLNVPQMGDDPLTVTGRFEGDNLNGIIVSPMGELPFTGARRVADPLEAVVGEWDVTTTYNGQSNTSSLKVENLDGALKITYTGDLGTIDAVNPAFEDDALSWGLKIPQLGREPLQATATVRDGRLTGQYTSDFGNVEISGSKKAQ